MLAGARDPASGLAATMIASVLLLVGATSVFVELKGSLDETVGHRPAPGLAFVVFLRTRLHAFGLVLVLAFLLLVSLALSAALAVLERYAGGVWSSSYGIFSLRLLADRVRGHRLPLRGDLQGASGCAAVVARRVDRRRLHGGAVQPREVRDRAVPGQQRRGLELRRGRLAHRRAAVGLLLGADLLPGRRVHAAVRPGVRQPPNAGRPRRAVRDFRGMRRELRAGFALLVDGHRRARCGASSGCDAPRPGSCR